MIAGLITARWLGPSGKGIFSTLTFLSGLFMQACCLGLGDAAIVLIGQKKASIQEALSATLTVIFISVLVGMAGLWAVCALQFRSDWLPLRGAVLIAAVGLLVSVYAQVLSHLLNAQERIVSSSLVLLITSGFTTLGTWLFIAAVPLSILGGVLAGLLGSGIGLVVILVLLARTGLSLRPGWHPRYLAAAFRYGVKVQASSLLMAVAGRVDLLLVYWLAGQAAAGYYSVALTIGTLVMYVAWALSIASFPRLAYLDETEALALTAQICRCGLAATLVVGVPILLATPIVVPFLFGSVYRPAVQPAIILLGGGMIWSLQWLLCRARAARGQPELFFYSFGASLVIMCLLDYLLIPAWGITGAALAASVGPAAGLAICLLTYSHAGSQRLPISELRPTASDFRAVVALPLRLLSSVPGRALASWPRES